jgi:hypothetical protein
MYDSNMNFWVIRSTGPGQWVAECECECHGVEGTFLGPMDYRTLLETIEDHAQALRDLS